MGRVRKEVQPPRSRFITVKCSDCEAEQVTFDRASVKVHCQACGATLVEPRGGLAHVRSGTSTVLE